MNRDSIIPQKFQPSEISIPPLAEAMMKYDKTGTADIAVDKDYGISIKDEGDFVSVRFGSNKLTPIGSTLFGERNFQTKNEAFELAKQIQDILARGGKRDNEAIPTVITLPHF